MLSKKSNIKEYLNNKASQTRAALGFAGGGQYCYKLNFSPLPMERRGKCSMKYSRPFTLHIVKMGIPLSKGEGRVRVQHGRLKNSSRQTSSFNTSMEGGLKKW